MSPSTLRPIKGWLARFSTAERIAAKNEDDAAPTDSVAVADADKGKDSGKKDKENGKKDKSSDKKDKSSDKQDKKAG